MRHRWRRHTSWTVGCLAVLSLVGACSTEPEVYSCVVQADCPASLVCLQQVCKSIPLPDVRILQPEDGQIYPWMNDGTQHAQTLVVTATNLTLRSNDESSERVIGEGHLVVYVDEVEVATIESGDLVSGIPVEITFDDTPGVHRLRVQAKLGDGSDYDNDEGSARMLIWVDDGLEHVALRVPWPGDRFSLEEQVIPAEVAVMSGGEITLGPPKSGDQNTKIYYDAEPFDACLMESECLVGYIGIVPNDSDEFGPIYLAESEPGTATLTVLVNDAYHTVYTYTDDMGLERVVHSSIEIERTTVSSP